MQMKESFGQRYDAFSFNNSAYRDHAESFSSSNRTVVSRKALSNPIASVGNVIATPPIDDEVPHIAPLEAIKSKSCSFSNISEFFALEQVEFVDFLEVCIDKCISVTQFEAFFPALYLIVKP